MASESIFKMSDCFGKTVYQRMDPDTIVAIEPANCTDKDGQEVYRILVNTGSIRPYFMNESELGFIFNSQEALKRDMKAQELQELREGLLLD